jgi:hypothetical protein
MEPEGLKAVFPGRTLRAKGRKWLKVGASASSAPQFGQQIWRLWKIFLSRFRELTILESRWIFIPRSPLESNNFSEFLTIC